MKTLPEEMMIQVLERLPVKFLLRCMCVQKSWYSLIKSPSFVTAHLIYQKTHHPFLLFRSDHYFPTPLSLHVDNVQCEECDLLSSPPIWPDWHRVSNGLICLSSRHTHYDSLMCLWNPAIRKFKKIPDPPRSGIPCSSQEVNVAFGFCPEANDFKVIRIVNYSFHDRKIPRTVVDVYSLAKNSWKTNNKNLVLTCTVCDSDSVFLNGTAFFMGRNVNKEFTIVCYDTKKDMMSLISLPEGCAPEHFVHYSIEVFGKSVALFAGHSAGYYIMSGYDMWLLEERANKVCWEKKISIFLPESEFGWRVLGMRSNGEVLLESKSLFDRRMVSKNVEKDEIMDFGWVTPPHWIINDRLDFKWVTPLRCVDSFAESLIMINT